MAKGNKNNKVYIPNKGSGHDYSAAEQHGKLVFVTSGYVNPYNTGTLYRKWQLALSDSEDNDLIVVTSLPVLCMIGASLFAAKHKRLNLLIYKSDGTYQRRDMVVK